jgi:hypothetical protein
MMDLKADLSLEEVRREWSVIRSMYHLLFGMPITYFLLLLSLKLSRDQAESGV